MARRVDEPKKERGAEFYPSPERMKEIEEVFRKMGLNTSQGYVCESESPSKKCWVTSLSNSTTPYPTES